MADIKIRISKTFPPTITAEVDGMQGGGCVNFLDQLQEAMKLETRKQRLKPDFKTVKQKIPTRR